MHYIRVVDKYVVKCDAFSTASEFFTVNMKLEETNIKHTKNERIYGNEAAGPSSTPKKDIIIPNSGDFIVVELAGKKIRKEFVAHVINTDGEIGVIFEARVEKELVHLSREGRCFNHTTISNFANS